MSSITRVNSAGHVTVNFPLVRLHQLRTQSLDVSSFQRSPAAEVHSSKRTMPSRLPIGGSSGAKASTHEIRLDTGCEYFTLHTKTDTPRGNLTICCCLRFMSRGTTGNSLHDSWTVLEKRKWHNPKLQFISPVHLFVGHSTEFWKARVRGRPC